MEIRYCPSRKLHCYGLDQSGKPITTILWETRKERGFTASTRPLTTLSVLIADHKRLLSLKMALSTQSQLLRTPRLVLDLNSRLCHSLKRLWADSINTMPTSIYQLPRLPKLILVMNILLKPALKMEMPCWMQRLTQERLQTNLMDPPFKHQALILTTCSLYCPLLLLVQVQCTNLSRKGSKRLEWGSLLLQLLLMDPWHSPQEP